MFWKLLAVSLLVQGVLSPILFAQKPCVPGTLADYIALPPVPPATGGCTIAVPPVPPSDHVNLNDFLFSVISISGGAIPVEPGQIMVTPISTAETAGLDFTSSGFSVTAGQSIQYLLTYNDQDPPVIHAWELDLSDPVTFPAFVNITSMECIGAAFDGPECPTGPPVINTVMDNGVTAVLSDTQFFQETKLVSERTIITLDATAGGNASFTGFSEQALVVPEPSYAPVSASVLALMFLIGRLRSRRKLAL